MTGPGSMNKTLQAAPTLDTSGARAADDDPWSEFLSESSGEFQQQSEEAWAAEGEGDLSTPPAPTTQFVSPDVVPSSDASPTWVTPSVPWDPAPSRRQEQQSTEVVPFRESAHSGSTGNQISLADVIARQVPVVWSEAVATIEELCAVLINTGSPRAAVPELSDVMITPAGTVTIRHGAIGDRDLRSIGHRLHALLSATDTPLPLRLFVTSSISSDRYHSVELYSRGVVLLRSARQNRTDPGALRAHTRSARVAQAVTRVARTALPCGLPPTCVESFEDPSMGRGRRCRAGGCSCGGRLDVADVVENDVAISAGRSDSRRRFSGQRHGGARQVRRREDFCRRVRPCACASLRRLGARISNGAPWSSVYE